MKARMKPQLSVAASATDDTLRYLRQMNVNHCFVMFQPEECEREEQVLTVLDRVRKAGLTITDAGCNPIYKHPAIQFGLPERDDWIERYNKLNRWLGHAGVPVGYATWEPHVGNTRWQESEKAHGAVTRVVELSEITARGPYPATLQKEYSEEEIWANFEYFLRAALPVCKEANMRLALHPNDPPVPFCEGSAQLIHSSECYRRAMRLGDSIEPGLLGVKFCCGCWLEGGKAFGDVLSDLREFVRAGRVHIVHFRNVSAPLPDFEETLLEDGYFDMYEIMKVLVEEDYAGTIYVDHSPRWDEATGGERASFAYATGYMKGLMHAAYAERASAR
ncbi:MAG: mannonate dehydratase [Clostridia bacterium]|nr:mannonate dehydratase [Clostridia bacterium]